MYAEENMEIVIVCFGTGEVTGDSLAPMVGTALKEKYNIKTFVYGDLNDDINAKKIDSTLDMIHSVHQGSVVIAVDACVGKKEDVGKIVVKEGVRPKAALDKTANAYGDIGILGIVAPRDGDTLTNLLSADFSLVCGMSERIAKAIYTSFIFAQKCAFVKECE